jgi:lysophospholipase L1-like esterase
MGRRAFSARLRLATVVAGLLASTIFVVASATGAPSAASLAASRQTTHPSASGHVMGRKDGHGLPWSAAWRAAPTLPDASGPSHDGIGNQTVRMNVWPTVGGQMLRVRLSNAYGSAPLTLANVTVADPQAGSTVDARSLHHVTFGGAQSVTIPVGQEVVSDPVSMTVHRHRSIAVSVFAPNPTGPTTWHYEAETTSYISTPGDWTSEPGGSPFQTIVPSWFFLDGVDVVQRHLGGTVVAFGDSITDGHYSTIDAQGTWPDWLSRRLPDSSVLNEGIGGNRILSDTTGVAGVSALHRFQRDALDQLGATSIVFLEGINDIGSANATADELIAGMKTLIHEAHAAGLTIVGGTLTPFEGASYYTPAGEQQREAVNRWIRTSGAFDAVADFDRAVRDPRDPLRLDPRYDTGGGHLHPNDLGYEAMADAIPLRALRR